MKAKYVYFRRGIGVLSLLGISTLVGCGGYDFEATDPGESEGDLVSGGPLTAAPAVCVPTPTKPCPCSPDYGLYWVNHTWSYPLSGMQQRSNQEVDTATDTKAWFDPSLPTIIHIHGGYHVPDGLTDENIEACAAKRSLAGDVRAGYINSGYYPNHNVAYFDWQVFATDAYWKMTAKIWGEQASNAYRWGNDYPRMRYRCKGRYSGYTDELVTKDIGTIFDVEYTRILNTYLKKGKKLSDVKISIIADSMGTHVAMRFVKLFKAYAANMANQGKFIPMPVEITLRDPVLHIKHIEENDLDTTHDENRTIDLGIIDAFKDAFVLAHQAPTIKTSVYKSTQEASIDPAYGNTVLLKARKAYYDMTKYGRHIYVDTQETNPTYTTLKSSYEKNLTGGSCPAKALLGDQFDTVVQWGTRHSNLLLTTILWERSIWKKRCPKASAIDEWLLSSKGYVLRAVSQGIVLSDGKTKVPEPCFDTCKLTDPDTSERGYTEPTTCGTYTYTADHQYSE